MKQLLRKIPPIHELQRTIHFEELLHKSHLDSSQLTVILQMVIKKIREKIMEEDWNGPEPGTDDFFLAIFEKANAHLSSHFSYTLKRVINGTGTILHTNLGRARLSNEAIKHVVDVSSNYTNLEYDLKEGNRGSRHTHAEELIKQITGAEAAMVVNNNAASVYLILRAFAKDREVIVSRGQLVEIGGSFRVSSIMEESGAKLIEVGTTNKTHLYDYENAISEDTSILMKVHTSNFKITGFTKTVETSDLVSLVEKHDHVIFYEDLGSGVLYDFNQHGIGDEPVVSDVLKMGADLVSFSGDKLLGGPQAGIIAGKKRYIDRLKKHQLARVLRVDKMTLAALEGTLLSYVKGVEHIKSIPTVRNLLETEEELFWRAKSFAEILNNKSDAYITTIIKDMSQVGGGTMPDVLLPTYVVSIKHHTLSINDLTKWLRTEAKPAIVVRVHKDQLFIDLRTVSQEEEQFIIDALLQANRTI